MRQIRPPHTPDPMRWVDINIATYAGHLIHKLQMLRPVTRYVLL